MTSDAKIGLLLGLVFIFLIAFIINGLPSFNNDKDNNELTLRIAKPQNDTLGLAAKERKAHFEVINPTGPDVSKPIVSTEKTLPEVEVPAKKDGTIRFERSLPKKPLASKESKAARETPKNVERVSNKEVLPKVYVVAEGESLAIITKKFYGEQEGNKAINVNRIYEANRKNLKSADEIYVGQKLVIPLLRSSARDKNKIESIFSPRVFKKVESIGKRHPASERKVVVQTKGYVVREGDSLWRIATEKLGNGNRFHEITKLNTDILNDEDSLAVGMQLKIPVR